MLSGIYRQEFQHSFSGTVRSITAPTAIRSQYGIICVYVVRYYRVTHIGIGVFYFLFGIFELSLKYSLNVNNLLKQNVLSKYFYGMEPFV